MGTLLIEHASELLTLAGPARARTGDELGELGIVADGALFARDGAIEAVGPTSEVADRCEADTVRIDARHRRITLEVPERELRRRARAWRAPKPYATRGVLAKYAASVSSASYGAVTDGALRGGGR